MRRSQFVTRSLTALALVLVSFVILGFSRLVLPYRVARLLAAPTLLLAAALTLVVLSQAILVAVGVREFD
ncbi:hypothetical protein HALDL1_09325 [Halobacterium sp. DL1]|jgi:glucan phosphoethanolaminetransferase (alkaline phosphatase superfamily)|nr:hypothetical protein HALDL1_09325 [Halobacterium sp. DL1]